MKKSIKNILLIVILVVIDQILKLFTLKFLEPVGSVTVINGIFNLTYLENTGAAFGIWSNRWMLVFLNCFIIFIIFKLMISKAYEITKQLNVAYILILSGGITNVIDRVFRGYVIDYIDINELVSYPIFNFADICIVVGVAIIMLNIIISTLQKQEQLYEETSNKKGK